MAFVNFVRVAATVTATGGASQAFFSDRSIVGGYIESIVYRRGAVTTATTTTSGISTAAHINIRGALSGTPIFDGTATGDVTWYPRAAAMGTTGNTLGYSSAATPPVIPVPIPIVNERIRVEFTSGGAASAGGVHSIIDILYSGV